MTDYLSDASMSSESDDEIDPPEIWCERELEYWALEDVLDNRPPPPVIEYLTTIGLFHVRECVVGSMVEDPNEVMDSISANNWHAFWQNGRENNQACFSFEDFDIIGEYCMLLCDTCQVVVTNDRIKSCALRILKHGKFI